MPEDVDPRQIAAEEGLLVLRRSTAKGSLPDTLDLIPSKPIANGALRNAIAAVTDEIIGDTGSARAVEQLLTRQVPSFDDGPRPGGIVDPDGDRPTQSSATIRAMDRTTLAIHGPPGTGRPT